EAVVQQQNGRRGDGGIELNDFRFVVRELNRTAGLVGGSGRIRRGNVIGDQERLRGVEGRAFELFERRVVVRVHLPVREQFGAGQGAGEFKQGKLAVGREHSRELVGAARFGEAWLGNDVERLRNAKSLLGRIELCVQQVQEPG